jgi:hypothetical protein
MLPKLISTLSGSRCAMLFILPVDSLSITTTSLFFDNFSTIWLPINPKPPVTAIFLFLI